MRTTTDPWPSVTAVVATRDRPQLLRRAVRRILQQRYAGALECVVVFDQAEPFEVEPGSDSVRQLSNRRSAGLAGARNSGILEAAGKLVAFCDDDDEWRPDKLRVQVEAMRAANGAVAAACGCRIHSRRRVFQRLPTSDTASLADLVRSRRMELHSSTLVIEREALLDRIGLVDEAVPGSYGEDYDLILRAATVSPIATPREALVEIHWDGASFFEEWATMAAALRYLLDKHPELRWNRPGCARIHGQIAFSLAASGNGKEARKWATSCLRLNPRELRGYMAIAASAHLLTGDTALRIARRAGKGI